MSERPAASSEDSSRRGSHPGATGASGVDAAAANHAEESPGSKAGCEEPDLDGWHEAGPAAGLVARRWALEVLRVLDQRGPTRFNDLRRETGAAGQPLKATLDALARAGLVSRHVIRETSPRSVSYCLTPAARDLFPALSSIAKWHRANGAGGGEPRG